MSFIKHLETLEEQNKEVFEDLAIPERLQESKALSSPEDVLTSAGFKIKSRILTNFGNEYETYKKVDTETIKLLENIAEVKEVLQKNNLIFILI